MTSPKSSSRSNAKVLPISKKPRDPAAPSLGELIFQGAPLEGQVARRLAGGEDPDERDSLGWTALMRACSLGGRGVELVEALLGAGADPNVESVSGPGPYTGALCQATSASQLALRCGRSILSSPGIDGKEVAYQASRTMALLLDHGADLAKAAARHSGLGVACAAMAGNSEQLRSMLRAGDDPNVLEDSFCARMSAVWIAAAREWTEGLEILMEYGADPNADRGGALSRAAETGSVEIVELLLRHGADVSGSCEALREAAGKGQADCVAILVRAGADVLAADARRVTPAMEAIGRDKRQSLVALIEAGLDLQALLWVEGSREDGKDRRSLGHYAAQCRASECIEEMVQRGYDFGKADNKNSALASIILQEQYEGPMGAEGSVTGTWVGAWVEAVQRTMQEANELLSVVRDTTSQKKPRL